MRHIRLALTAWLLVLTAWAQAQTPTMGVVLMHGKGGSPTKHVDELASALQRQGVLVANLEMPWSGHREYDVDVAAADREVEAALAALREKGAAKLFVAGHSQGGVFALHSGSRQALDGIIAIAPGGNVANATYVERLGPLLQQARALVQSGQGDTKVALADFESAKGTYPVTTTPRIYVSWFDPDGAMNQTRAIRALPTTVPVLYVVPVNDYPALQRVKTSMFAQLPPHPKTRLFEPVASHVQAPAASAQEILDWMRGIANP